MVSGQEPDVGTSLSPSAAPPGRSSSPEPAGTGDEQRFRDLFERTYTPLTAYARRRISDSGEADDVVAEVYTTAWRRRDHLPPDAPHLPWLYGIAANVVRNHHRARGRQLRLVDKLSAQPDPSPDLAADPADRAGADLRHALSTLSPDDQEILRLVAWEGLTHQEIGTVLGCSANAVALRLRRARQRLDAALTTLTTPPPSDTSANEDHLT